MSNDDTIRDLVSDNLIQSRERQRTQRIATYLRQRLCRGYNSDSRFYRLVHALTDEQIIQRHDAHHATKLAACREVQEG